MKVELLEIFGNDEMVVNAARVSFGKEANNYSEENNARDIDQESGLLHAAHLQCNAAMLAEFHFTHPEFDDRVKYDKDGK